jgi:hypothetical protein
MRAAAGWLVAIGAGLLCSASMAAEGSVSGQFRVGDREIKPTVAAAYPVRDPRNPRVQAIEVLLSEGPVDVTAAVAALSPHQNVINQKGIGNYIMLWVRPDREVSMNATFAPSMTQYLDKTGGGWPIPGSLVAAVSATGPERVAGRVYTRQPVQTKGHESYQLDVRFDVPVTRPAVGKRLDAHGGAPGRAFSALYAAVTRKDWPAVRALLSQRTLAVLAGGDSSGEQGKDYALEALGIWLPSKRMKVTGGELRGDQAILDVEGESAAGARGLYLVRMVREADDWRFDEAALAGLP